MKTEILDTRSGIHDSQITVDPELLNKLAESGFKEEEELPTSETTESDASIKYFKTENGQRAVITKHKSVESIAGNEEEFYVPEDEFEEEYEEEGPKKLVGMTEDTVQKLLKIHTMLWNEPWGDIFHYPVSVADAPDYDNVIKHRMDLSTLKQKLLDGEIASPDSFFNDLMLMFKNALTYNMKGSEIYNITKKARKQAQKLMEPLMVESRQVKSAGKQRKTKKKMKEEEEEDDLDDELSPKKYARKVNSSLPKKRIKDKKADSGDYVFY